MMQANQLEIQYGNMPDEKVIQEIQSGDNIALNYLMNKYNDLVNMKASKFFMAGAG